MPFKFNADGTIAMDAAAKLPIFIHANGTEAPFDADNTVSTITRLNGEAKTHREAKEAAELKLKSFDGIEVVPGIPHLELGVFQYRGVCLKIYECLVHFGFYGCTEKIRGQIGLPLL